MIRNKTTEVTESTETGFLESQNMLAKKLILFRLILRGYILEVSRSTKRSGYSHCGIYAAPVMYPVM